MSIGFNSGDAVWLIGAVGYLLLGGLFVVAGVRRILIWRVAAGAMQSRGVPFPLISFWAGTAFQIIAGLSLALSVHARWAAIGLVAFTLAAGVIALNFWSKDGEARKNAINSWLNNLAIIGGLLLIVASQ